MRHPPRGFWVHEPSWCVFVEDRTGGRAVRDVVLRGVPRDEAESTARKINFRRRLRFGRSPFCAAPEDAR